MISGQGAAAWVVLFGSSLDQWWHKFRKKTCLGKLGVAVGMISLGGAAAVFLPAGAAAGALAVTGAAAGQIIGGVGGNLFSACMDPWFRDNSLDPSEKLNHDIELVVGNAIEGVLRELIKQASPHAAAYKRLLKSDVAEVWHKLMIEFDQQTAFAIPDPQRLLVLAAEARETGVGDKLPGCLDKPTWKSWLVRVDSRGGELFPEAVLDELADALVKRFYWHVVEALKADFEQDGKAYAAIQMHTAASTLALVRLQSKALEALNLKLGTIEDYIINKANTIAVVRLDDAQLKLFRDEFGLLHVKLDSLHALARRADDKLDQIVNHQIVEIDRLRSEHKDKDSRIARLEASLAEVKALTAAGDPEAEAALAYARKTDDVSLVMILLARIQSAEAERERVRRVLEGTRLFDRALELSDYHFRKGNVPLGKKHLAEGLEFVPSEPVALSRLCRFAESFAMLDAAEDAYRKLLRLNASSHWSAITESDLGDIELARGDRSSALVRYKRYLEYSKAAADNDANAATLRSVSTSLDQVGNVERAESGAKAALPFYVESLEISRRIVKGFGETTEALRDVSASLSKVGDAELAESGATAALPFYAESLEISRRIVKGFGETPEALRDVSVSLNKVGDAELAESGAKTALPFYAESLEIARRIVKGFGETPQALRDVYVLLTKVGDAERAESGAKAALPLYAESLEICRRIVKGFGETPQALRDVSISLNRVGDAELAKSGATAALPFYAESLAISRRIVKGFGETPQALRDVSISLYRTGDVKAKIGDKAGGLAEARDALDGFEDVGRRWGMIPKIVQDIAQTRALIAYIEAL